MQEMIILRESCNHGQYNFSLESDYRFALCLLKYCEYWPVSLQLPSLKLKVDADLISIFLILYDVSQPIEIYFRFYLWYFCCWWEPQLYTLGLLFTCLSHKVLEFARLSFHGLLSCCVHTVFWPVFVVGRGSHSVGTWPLKPQRAPGVFPKPFIPKEGHTYAHVTSSSRTKMTKICFKIPLNYRVCKPYRLGPVCFVGERCCL